MSEVLRVGTRSSPLARAQSELVVRALQYHWPRDRFELVPIATTGDRDQQAVGTLDFTDRIDAELEAGRIDLAVHSTKDLPSRVTRRVVAAAYPRRADPRDCLVLDRPGTFTSLPAGSRIGSSSVRRRAQLLRWRPDVELVPVRGNVGSRISKIATEDLAGVILAVAGLLRLGWVDRISEYLPWRRILPAPGQGALSVHVRSDDVGLARKVAVIDHARTRAAVIAELGVLAELGGNCDIPLGAYAVVRGSRLRLRAALLSTDGRKRMYREIDGQPGDADRLGRQVGTALARSDGSVGVAFGAELR